MEYANLLTTSSLVEAPFITAKIGDYTFGCYKNSMHNAQTVANVNTPNYVTSISIKKINGAVNQYTLNMTYAITQFSDPNYIEKVMSSVSSSRKIIFSYGDCNEPSFTYNNEEALITNATRMINFSNATINYKIEAISSSMLSLGAVFDWPEITMKPSARIRQILQQSQYGLKDIFTGMQKSGIIDSEHLIPNTDKQVVIQAKQGMSAFDYIVYLTQCMQSSTDNQAIYRLNVVDSNDPPMYGTYFKISEISPKQINEYNINALEVNVGYPSNPLVISFSMDTQDQWTMLYNYSEDKIDNKSYYIDNNGNLVIDKSNKLIQDTKKGIIEDSVNSWWKQVTEFPVKATLTIKGLLRAAKLMQYVKINCYFYGQKFIASGLYVITEQNDTVDQNGYRTQLSLLRVGGDDLGL